MADLSASARPTTTGPALLPLAWRTYRAPRWWFEVALVVILDVVYEHLRDLVPTHQQQAINRGLNILHFTQRLHWDVELSINHFVVHHEWLAQIANYDYSFFHLPVTAGVLIWLFWRHRRVYRTARMVLLLTTLLGLIGFWIFPMAPPRLLPGGGFVDTVVYFKTLGSWGSPAVADHSNLYAAMPSLHCAWSLWVGLSVFFVARNKIVRTISVFYPFWTVFVVIATANHFLLDALAGWSCIGLSALAVWVLYGRNAWAPALTAEEQTLTRQELRRLPPIKGAGLQIPRLRPLGRQRQDADDQESSAAPAAPPTPEHPTGTDS
ncbi:PAP2 superfamily protein [Rudaeicoccus suwonensis]|uniref:PAP2 superfamily protein n=1 Tax=Rudaeicoccus suwonensis TaxID=657409 RepID=A0A561E3B0_9MICO|nr:PAP2 superfamily protein [Rudaeicoccus suwonensis]